MDHLQITPSELVLEDIVARVRSPAAGGIAVFLGTTRAQTNTDGRQLLALDYDAYQAMAQHQLLDLAKRAREQWPITALAIVHRTGRVEIGHASVIIAVSTPHRAEAFQACQWLIDTLKKELTIWKKEIWQDGTATWSGTIQPDLK